MAQVKGYDAVSASSKRLTPEMKVPTSTGGNLTSRGYPSSYTPQVDTGGDDPTKKGKVPTGGTTTGGAVGGSGYDSAAAYNALLAAYRQNDYSDYLAQMRAAAQSAYDRSMSALNSAYDEQMNSLNKNLSSTNDQLLNNYNYSRKNISNDAESSLRQAYINNMMNRRNLGQMMTAQGLSGGATESTLAGMLNNYGNARNNINTTANRSYADLENNYNSNLSQAQQAYNSAVANANLQKAQQQIQLENALSNNQISALSDYQSLMQRENQNYLDLLKTAIANGANFAYTPTVANNPMQAVNVTQAANPTAVTNYAALQALMNAQTGTPGSGAVLSTNNANANALAAILAELQKGA